LLPLLAFVLLTAGNAFFVAAEFSLVTVNRADVDRAAAEGDATARSVRAALRELSFQLSGAQLGITITALLTGYLAEPALAKLFLPLVSGLGKAAPTVAHALALVLATVLSMLFGELVPKNLAIARPMPTARATARPQRMFSKTFGWLIRALNGSANWLVRRMGVEPQEELASARSPEELGLLAAYSAKAGALPEETAVLLRRTIRFGEKRAAEAMTPRVDVIAIEANEPVEQVLSEVRDTGLSRYPVYERTLDQIIGVVTVIDALGVPPARRPLTTVRQVAREPVLVPESLDLDGVLAMMQAAGEDFAIVIDEYGGTDGVVTIEDLVEELVGEITDEHDIAEPLLADVTPLGPSGSGALGSGVLGGGALGIGASGGGALNNGVGGDGVTAPAIERSWLVDGVLREDELFEVTAFRLPEGPYETLAGFLMARLGHIPVAGETVSDGEYEFTVVEVERRRIEQVRVVHQESSDD